MKNRSFVRIKRKTALLGVSLLTVALLSGCGSKNEAIGLHQTGTVAFMLNCDDAASVYFEKAIAADPSYAPSYIMLGDCYLREGKYQKAVEAISTGLTLDMDAGHKRLAHRKLARAYKMLGNPEKALEHITLYARMSAIQEKLNAQKISETETFVAELELPEGTEVMSVQDIVEESMHAAKTANATIKQPEKVKSDILNMLTFGLM